MLKNIKNKFIIGIILLIIAIVGFQIVESKKIDRNSYVTLVEGTGYLYKFEDEIKLEKNSRERLNSGDTIKTMGGNSLAVIEWGDGSITRLGANSELKVRENEVSDNLNTIQISFDLEKGKTWSNVINFMGEDSYFKEYYVDMEAAVRGTVFEVNLENNYVYVDKHEITVTKDNGDSIVVPEKKPFDIRTFSFIALQKFLQDSQDIIWSELNKRMDKDFFIKLKGKLGELQEVKDNLLELTKGIEALKGFENADLVSLQDSLSSLNEKTKEELYAKVLERYQGLNFVSVNETGHYDEKLKLKKLLVALSGEADQKNLIRTTLYDLKQIELNNTKAGENLGLTLNFLNDNKEILKKLDINILEYLNFDFLPEELKNQFKNQYEFVNEAINIGKGKVIDSASKLIDLGNTAKDALDKLRDSFINK
ncbi:MAG: FecR domain-containing protein [Candidatus Gracilibacteria bacterium]|nr:FecR domain-containing protein [Candidatus Gracilibacteria bacterium]